jgi:futalosine hydrolase
MKIVLFAATTLELPKLLNKSDVPAVTSPFYVYRKIIEGHHVDFIITGIGLIASAYAASKIRLNDYDLFINAGIAGSFDKKINIGDCVLVKEERIIELGAEDNNKWLRTKDMKLNEPDTFNLNLTLLPKNISSHFTKTKKVKAISANTAHGNAKSINRILELYPAQIESMEGAAIAFATCKYNLPLLEIRCISNYVEKRDKSKWNIPLAVANLNSFLLDFLAKLK